VVCHQAPDSGPLTVSWWVATGGPPENRWAKFWWAAGGSHWWSAGGATSGPPKDHRWLACWEYLKCYIYDMLLCSVSTLARYNVLGCHSITSSGFTALLKRLGGFACRLLQIVIWPCLWTYWDIKGLSISYHVYVAKLYTRLPPSLWTYWDIKGLSISYHVYVVSDVKDPYSLSLKWRSRFLSISSSLSSSVPI